MSDSFLLSTLNSYQGVLKVSSCSGSWFSPCRQRWQVPICSWHSLKLDSARMDTEGQGLGMVKKRTQRSVIKVWSRRESSSRDVCLWPLPSMPKVDLTSKQEWTGGFLCRCPWNRNSSTDPQFPLLQHSFQTTKLCWENYLFLLSHPLVPRQGKRLKHSLALLSCFSSLTPVWSMDGIRILKTFVLGDWWETERRCLSFLIVSRPPVIVSCLLNTLQFQSFNISQRRKTLRNLNLTYSACSFESLPDLFLLLLFFLLARLHGLWVLSFPTRDWTQVTPVKGQGPNHWTTREFPRSTSSYARLDSLLCTQDECVIDTYQWDEAFPPNSVSYCV